MNRKINLLEFSHQRDYGGTDKMSEVMMRYHNKDIFNILACSYKGGPREQYINDNNIPNLITNNDEQLINWIKVNNIDIAKIYRGGHAEPRDIKILKAAGVPIIVEQNCFGNFDSSPEGLLIDIHVVNSNTSQTIYQHKAGNKYLSDKVRMIYCPIENHKFNKIKIDYSKPIFGRYSRKDPSKWGFVNLTCLKYVREAIPEAKFYVIGLPDNYREAAKKIGVYDMIEEFEAPTDEDILNFISKITVFSHAALVGESFGNVLAESMAAGLPILTHQGGDSAQAEVVTDGFNGYVIEDMNDEKTYADKLVQLLKNPSLKEQMGQNGQKRSQDHFDVYKVVKKFEDLYFELMIKKGLL